jgi:hypothetical protein
MIEFTDNTLIEAKGDYNQVTNIMLQESTPKWMIQTDAVIRTESFISSYVLNFWDNGDIYIFETSRPPDKDLPDDDLVFLRSWVDMNNWKRLLVSNNFLEDPRWFSFWLTYFRSGIIYNEKLKQFEQDNTYKHL